MGKSSTQKHQRPGGKHGNDFAMGTGKPYNNYNNKPHGYQQDSMQTPWKPEDSKEKAKLKEQAIAMQKKVTMEKNEAQKIRLILNVITPENFEKKFRELRQFQFDGLKTREECQDEGIDYSEEFKLTAEKVRQDILETIVNNIFRKAQVEKEYCIFYGELCEKMIKLELSLRT